MTTTLESLEAMRRADWRRASRAGSSMHRSWLDAGYLAGVMRDLEAEMSLRQRLDSLIGSHRLPLEGYAVPLANTNVRPTSKPAGPNGS